MTDFINRKEFGFASAAALAFSFWPAAHALRAAVPPAARVRMAIALRAAFQSETWIGAEAGIFRRFGMEVTFPTVEAGGPQATAGTVRGDWDVCHTGGVPIVQGVLRGQDPVLIITPTELHDGVYVMARREITKPEQLVGAKIGAVDATGQLGRPLQALLQKWGVSASVVSLGSFQAIYAALGAGSVDAGYLPVDLRFRGEKEFGWNALHGLTAGIGGIVTSRRFIAANRELVAEFVKGVIEAIHMFKTQPDTVIPLLGRFLQLGDRETLEQLHAFYAPIYRAVPTPTFFSELENLQDTFSQEYPAVRQLQSQDLCDSSFVDEVERSGYIRRLYS
jgi:ABC-type nitrate/sulfonate/bicarbonate transport system substrate-binding protein